MKKSNHNRHVHVMTKLHEIEALQVARKGIREMIDEATDDLQYAYDLDQRDMIGNQISILYAVHDAIGQNIKDSVYIWN
jgi:hypothetical protein